MKRILLLLPLFISCVPETPKDVKSAISDVNFDPLAAQAWHLENRGQASYSFGLAKVGEDHKIKEAHALGYTGKNIRIAVSDTGVQISHPDLSNNELVGEHRDYVNGASPDFLGDPVPGETNPDAHGTAVTGLIAAEKGNTVGSFGVAPDAQFAGFNYLIGQEPTKYLHQFTGDFRIFNYSYGISGLLITLKVDSDIEAALKLGVQEGKIYVKAAGNDYSKTATVNNDDYPFFANANYEAEKTLPYYIIVGAVNAKGKKSSYSTPGSNLWISGAGGEYGTDSPAMITTDLTGCEEGYAHKKLGRTAFDKGLEEANRDCDYTNGMNGTSSATPMISGIIALMLEANPNLTWRDVKHILAKTADVIDYSADSNSNKLSHPNPKYAPSTGSVYDVKWTQNAAGNFFSNWYGFGRANALKAVLMASTYTFPLGTYIEGTPKAINVTQDGDGNAATQLPIPTTGVSLPLSLSSADTNVKKIESVQVEVTLQDAGRFTQGNLGVELTSPQGTVSRLLLINGRGINYANPNPSGRKMQLTSNAFYEENPLGTWTLKVIAGDSSQPEKLVGWSIKINGH